MAEGILTLYSHNSWTRLHSSRTKKNLHWILQVIGATLSIVGCYFEFDLNNNHLLSIHAWTGVVSLGFMVVTLINGISALWAQELRSYVIPVNNKFFHNFCGLCTFVIGMVSLIYGYDTGVLNFYTTEHVILALQIVCGVTTVLSLFGVYRSSREQITTIIRIYS